METLILIILALCIALFVVLFTALARTAYRCGKTETKIPVACAGSVEPGSAYWKYGLSMYTNEFLNPEGEVITADEYDIYITSGESMSLCGIHDSALLFMKKSKHIDLNSLAYPKILLLERDMDNLKERFKTATRQEPKFKIRRAWRTVRLDCMNPEEVLESISTEDKFRKLTESNKFIGWQEMKDNFIQEKLPAYRSRYAGCENPSSENNTAVISTTLHDDRILFSIHPARIVKGVIECFYNTVEEQDYQEAKKTY